MEYAPGESGRAAGFALNVCSAVSTAVVLAASPMATIKDYKLAQKSLLEQQQIVTSLQTLIADIERSETTIVGLQSELEQVNQKHAGRKSTREDIAYLTDLLRCANKKLAWEKQIASLQKRTPELLQRMTAVLTDEVNPPSEEIRVSMLGALKGVQAAMERLQQIKPSKPVAED
jgi:hypothetical protein